MCWGLRRLGPKSSHSWRSIATASGQANRVCSASGVSYFSRVALAAWRVPGFLALGSGQKEPLERGLTAI